MRLPLAWVRDYIDLDAPSDEIVRRLAMLGFPVESVERRPPLAGVVVGRVATVERHPNADRLSLCTLDVGADEPLTIATAATNVAAGQVVPVARIGAVLAGPDGGSLQIAPRTMRGIASQGMLCSAAELGLEADWFEDGILQLEPELAAGTDALAHYRLGDDVLEVEVTANRVDAMSVLGLARELAAAFEVPLREPATTSRPLEPPTASTFMVTLASPDCRRFVAQRVTGLRVGVSPAAMRIRLALAGQRPIDSIVDVSNFVMLELGAPPHFYDAAKLSGRALTVRDARAGELLRTLDGEERSLDESALVVADASGPIGLAGLRGGAASEVTAATTSILIETASFAGPRVRRMGARLGLRTDASSRHEKTIPLGLVDLAAARAAHLLEAAGARAHAPSVAGAAHVAATPIAVSTKTIERTLGFRPSIRETQGALERLGFTVTVRSAEWQFDDFGQSAYLATPPPWRGDVAIPVDVVEEVARAIGYDRIEAILPTTEPQIIASGDYENERRVAAALAALGYREAIAYSLQPHDAYETFARAGIEVAEPVEIDNPLSAEQRYLRFSLLPGLLALAAKFQAAAPLRTFEIGHTFARAATTGAPPVEMEAVAWTLVGARSDDPQWRDSGFLTFKGEAEALLRALTGRVAETVTTRVAALHPGKTASLVVGGKDVATIGAVDPRLLLAYGIERPIYAGLLRLRDLPAHATPVYRPASRFPAVERDLALVVAPDVPAREIAFVVRASGDGLVRGVRVFDEYRGPQVGAGKKSLAVRVTLQRDDATLTDAEVDACIGLVLAALRDQLGAEIRA
ncbi:MAG: phenylalanine--tRNA ligase subunit beta [Candidatus Baltobacteraceae bacterium]